MLPIPPGSLVQAFNTRSLRQSQRRHNDEAEAFSAILESRLAKVLLIRLNSPITTRSKSDKADGKAFAMHDGGGSSRLVTFYYRTVFFAGRPVCSSE